MLNIEDLKVEVNGREILHQVSLNINPGEIHVLFGPNGSGKTTLLMSIMGFPGYKVTGGKIKFHGKKINNSSLNERAKMGIGLSFQRPPTIKGVKMKQMLDICVRGEKDVNPMIGQLNFNEFMDRDLNDGFSGGEIKRSELLQLMAQDPELLLLDEPESGVDLENIALISGVIEELLQRGLKHQEGKSLQECKKERQKSGLIITHTGYILDYLDVDKGHVLMNGRLSCSGNPREMLKCIKEEGYNECVKCAS
ncbi:MAG: ABC transporter ATP-binding protein [Spirochaetota bacterium]|nr:ABC transporter ATP-binding protein [Spirochaetota bacterium]